MRRLIVLCLIGLLLVGCASGETQTLPTMTDPIPTTEPTLPPETTAPPDPAALLLEGMTLREKVGQLFVVRPESVTGGEPCTVVTEELSAMLKEYPVGGFALFAENLVNPAQLKALNESLANTCAIAPFLAVDEEGGRVARLANHSSFDLPRYRSAAAVGSSGDPEDALEMGRTIGTYLAEAGFNMDFAPVADVNTNPANPVIGNRAFSSDPELAAEMAAAAAEGLREQGIVPVFKHFPGHGDTAEDSHKGIAVSRKTAEEMGLCEWLPFRSAGVGDCVMVGHIAVPSITGDLTPATMSREVVTGILKEELGFSGLVITDSLEMGAVTEGYPSGEAALAALEAGCDLILMPENLPEAFEAVVCAVEEGMFPEETLDEIVLRILTFKINAGILKRSE